MLDDQGFSLAGWIPALDVDVERERVELDFDPFEAIAGGCRSSLPFTGIRALLLAVLEDGIRCFFSPVAQVRAEAEHWVDSNLRRTAFSFPVLCELFGIEPGAARISLHRLRAIRGTGAIARRRRRVFHDGRLG